MIENQAAVLTHKPSPKFEGYRAPFVERRLLLITIDGLLILFAIWLAFVWWGRVQSGVFEFVNYQMRNRWFWYPILFSGWWILAWLNDLYDIPSSYDKTLNIVRLALVSLFGLLIYLAAFFIMPETLPRIFFLTFLLLSTGALILWRIMYVSLSQILPVYHRILIVGRGERAQTITNALDEAGGGELPSHWLYRRQSGRNRQRE